MGKESKSYEDVEVLIEKRLTMYRRRDAASNNYYARATFPPQRGYKVFSTKTSDPNEARRVAKNQYYELAGRQSLNISTKTQSIVVLFNEWLDYKDRLKQRTHKTTYRMKYERFIEPYFSKSDRAIDDLHKLKQTDIDAYWLWRVNYWFQRSKQPEYVTTKWGNERPRFMTSWKNSKKTPSHTTLNIEVQMFRSFFKWAVSQGHLIPGSVPDVVNPIQKIEGVTHKLRGVFTLEEYKEVKQEVRRRAAHYEDAKGRKLVSNKFKAERMYCYFFLISSTGLRPAECRYLTFGMVKLLEDRSGKRFSVVDLPAELAKANPDGTRKGRRVYSFDDQYCYNRIHKRWREVLRETMGRADDDDYLFPKWVPLSAENREEAEWTPQKMSGSFRKLLQAAGMHRDEDGKPRSAYSLRKFYITQRIRHNTPLPALALNTGHDIQTMWKWYQHLNTDDIREYLVKRDPELMRQELIEIGEGDTE